MHRVTHAQILQGVVSNFVSTSSSAITQQPGKLSTALFDLDNEIMTVDLYLTVTSPTTGLSTIRIQEEGPLIFTVDENTEQDLQVNAALAGGGVFDAGTPLGGTIFYNDNIYHVNIGNNNGNNSNNNPPPTPSTPGTPPPSDPLPPGTTTPFPPKKMPPTPSVPRGRKRIRKPRLSSLLPPTNQILTSGAYAYSGFLRPVDVTLADIPVSGFGTYNISDFSLVPEPSVCSLLVSFGGASVCFLARRRKQAKKAS